MAEAESPRIGDAEVEELLGFLDSLLGRIEEMPGADGDIAREAVGMLAQVYGEALARMLAVSAGDPQARQRMAGDPLLGQLMVLHGLHPDPPERRVERAVADIQASLHGTATIELGAIDEGTAHLRVTASGCGSRELNRSIREIILGAAPELTEVDATSSAPAAFIPLGALHRKAHQ